ncbi:serine/threonine-protein kinase Nek1 isoform X2 [Strongylocentrotus purpuratus]|uniref:non-specific serine/threonine protein kinase n=1 Tax=Strongylocentrotus purpuratus TaxID=7668 RepID=A0A7M7SWP3_STRPU|nr:serine/threonine-protein kinase Nek1 isoform X2 [Strongylocentrotus purpuratus]
MDNYIKKKQIGEGSFGKALLVKSKADGKEYVIKEINISKMKRKEKEESKKEVAVLRKMKHPNIVSYAESFEERGNLYIVMDYCDGGDLYQAINRRKGVLFPEDEIMDWFVQICLALKHVHDRKILHRDIKSQNIFLTRKGIVKMGDFGIARVLNNTMELARTCIGTPYYLSPEMCENKPYNNKSDIWALGCVLYETLTLKHAFEAGNMKNLVLKIIRGSYPPVSPRYSYEVRNLVAQLFKRSARDRPSINSVLKKPFVQKRIEKFLTDAQVSDEFSHTILHRNARPAARGVGAPVFQKPIPRPISAAAAKKPPIPKAISNPAAKYGPSMAVKRPPSAGIRKSVEDKKDSVAKELEQRKRELKERENERRHKERQVRQQREELNDKQRMANMKKAREAGWKNTLLSSSSGSSNGGGGYGGGGGGAAESEYEEPPKKEAKYDSLHQGAKPERGNYDHYHQYLSNLRQQANGAEAGQGGAAMFKEDRSKRQQEEAALRRQIRERPVSASAANAAKRAENARHAGVEAAERAKMVNDFLLRKREAAAYKARAAVQLGWGAPVAGAGDARNEPLLPYGGQKKGADKDEQAYLDQLKAIRMQNYQERLNVRNKLKDDDPQISAEERRKKIEALKAQANQRAAKLKEQLEKQRRDAYEKEKRAWDDHLSKKRVTDKPAPSRPIQGPAAPVMPLTAVLRDVGVDITQPEQEMPLKKGENRVPVIPPAEENQGPAAPRKHWGGGATKAAVLANMPLEVTASNMEATNAGDMLMPKSSVAAPSVEANRKKWGAPGNTVVNALQMAEIKAGTMTIAAGAVDAKGETQLLKGPAMYDRGSPMGVTVIKEQPMSPREKIPIVKDNMCVVDGKQSGDSKEAADLETIDAENKEDAAKQTPPSPSRPAWKAASSSSPSNQTQIDSAPKMQGSPNQKDQLPTSTTKDSPKSNSTPPRPTPDAEAPPTTDKATPPKSPRPSTSPPSVKTSPPSANSPSSSPLAKSPAKTDEEKEEEKISQEKKDADAVQLDEEDEDNQDIKEKSAKKKMIAGLSTGFFDTAPKLLRTCSDPDLRQLFRTTLALNPFFEADQKRVAQSVDTALNDQHDDDDDDDDLAIDDDEDDDDDEESDELIRQLQNLTAKNEEDEEEEEEKEEDDENEEDGVEEDVDEDEEEYQSLVESMRSVLEARDASDSPKMRRKKDEEEEKSPGGASNGSSPSSPSGSKDDEDEEEDEDDKENSGQSKPINEDWDSGEGSEGEESGMSAEERESVYSRLEESRLQLEKELGCDTFLKAYKSIQAMHEDEDENIEEGTKRVSTILGEGKGQVYTKILQLVMADGAYTEALKNQKN